MTSNNKLHGWNGKLLSVDLSVRRIKDLPIDKAVLKAYLGGRGLNMWLMHQNLAPSTRPFDPENLLIFGSGPLVGTTIPANGRYNVSSRSPLTGLLGDSNCAGFWAPALRKAGYDGIVVSGRADSPVYLVITNERTEIRDAAFLWGKTVSQTDSILREAHGAEAQVLGIGPAGEKKVRFAAILNNIDRAAGRTGNGAVMGSKLLKAIVVKSTGKVSVAASAAVRSVAKEIRSEMRSSPSFEVRSQYGTPMLVQLYNTMGVLPTHNHQKNTFAGADRISGERLKNDYVSRPESCFMCPVHCSRRSQVSSGRFAGVSTEGPEFETMCAMGSNLGNDDLESLIYLNRRLNDLGLDSISTGAVIGYAMECYQRGLIGHRETDGLDLTWGNLDAILEMVERIAARRGLGDLLAEGAQRASRRIKDSEPYALHIKGLEVPTQGVRGLKAWALGWAVASRGGGRSLPGLSGHGDHLAARESRAFFRQQKSG